MPASPGLMLGAEENFFPGICHGFYILMSKAHNEVQDKRKVLGNGHVVQGWGKQLPTLVFLVLAP